MKLKGCGTALVTPFKEDFSVDYEAFIKLVRRQIEQGIHFLVPLGTTGETPCLTKEEKFKIIELVLEVNNGKTPVICGAGSNNTIEVIKSIKEFSRYEIDGFLIVTPYYNKPTQDGLIKHFTAIADASEKPIVMYNVPGRTSVNMTAETSLRLAEHPNIVATKEASSNYAQISEIIRNAPEGFSVLSGNDDETLSLCVTGASGVVSVASNIAPSFMSEYLNFILAGDFAKARELHHTLFPLFKNCFIESNPIPVKAGLTHLGFIENVLRAPLYSSTKKTYDIMAETINQLGVKE
ncbi:MAG: 4-hydroxy-tetrahydrodipicolinate synthase [Ignavibacteria bacterium]